MTAGSGDNDRDDASASTEVDRATDTTEVINSSEHAVKKIDIWPALNKSIRGLVEFRGTKGHRDSIGSIQFYPDAPRRPAREPDLDVGDARRSKRPRTTFKGPKEVVVVSMPPRAADAVHVPLGRVSKMPEEKPPSLLPSDTSEGDDESSRCSSEEDVPMPPVPPPLPPPDMPPSSGPADDSDQEDDARGKLHCLADGRFYRHHPSGLIYDLGSDTPCGRLTGPFGFGKVKSMEDLSWSMKCRWAHSHNNCTRVKTNRQLASDETKLIAWLLDGKGLSMEAHTALP